MKLLYRSFVLLLATLVYGTVGYVVIEGTTIFKSFYMTVITISTVGYGEMVHLSQAGRAHTLILISVGITVSAYTIGTFLRMLIEGDFRKSLGRRKLEKEIAMLNDHYIICGFGRIGSLIADELKRHKIDFVVLENNLERVELLSESRILNLPLDATNDESLLKAGIMNAAGLVAAVQSDAENVFITLTAKGIRSDIFVLARSVDDKSEPKLKRAGADKVISPYTIGGKRMAQVLIRPTVVDFLDLAVMDNDFGLAMEEVRISSNSSVIGKKLMDNGLRQVYGVIIVLIKKIDGRLIFNPTPNEVLDANDLIVVMGEKDRMNDMGVVL